MDIALINKKTNICENIAVFETIETAQEMFGATHTIAAPAEGCDIGDIYIEGTWGKLAIAEPTAAQQRESAYSTLTHKQDGTPLIEWEGEAITVNTAAEKWMFYSSEGSEIANELSALIVGAKEYIRTLYPEG